MADKYLKLNTTTGRLEQVEGTTGAGAGFEGKLVALDETGYISGAQIAASANAPTAVINAHEDLDAGDIVNIFWSGSARKVRKAYAASADGGLDAHGYVKESFAAGNDATVYFDSLNTLIPVAGFTTSDVGKRLYLSATTPGAVVKVTPSGVGMLSQAVGFVIEVGGTYVTSEIEIQPGIKV